MPDQPWYLDGDAWTLIQKGPALDDNVYYETIFTQANGALGLRGCYEEDDPAVRSHREGYLAGVTSTLYGSARRHYDQQDAEQPIDQMVTLPPLFACEIRLHGERFRMTLGDVESSERVFSLRDGFLDRRVAWVSPRGRRTRLRFERFVSAAEPHLLCQRITLTPGDWDGPAELAFVVDGTVATRLRHGNRSIPGFPNHHFEPLSAGIAGNTGFLALDTRNGAFGLCIGSRIVAGNAAYAEQDPLVPDRLMQSVAVSLRRGASLAVERFVAIATTRDGTAREALEQTARGQLDAAAGRGFDAAHAAHRARWDARWQTADIEIEGAPRDEMIVRFNTFHLIQSAPFHTPTLSIPARGYSFNRYLGHIFWDTEIFMLPFFTFMLPGAARNLLAFRHHTLPAARANARRLGGKGAAFAFKVDPNDGRDVAPAGRGFERILHQNGDIAYALDQYLNATGDTAFLAREGIDLLVETARFYAGEAERDDRGRYHLNDMIGPDELYQPNRDNGYTNLIARFTLRAAAAWLERLASHDPSAAAAARERLGLAGEEPAFWRAVAEHLTVNTVPGLDVDVPLQDQFLMGKPDADMEGWRLNTGDPRQWRIPVPEVKNYRTIKQADIVLAVFLLSREFSREQIAAAYDFYEPRTLHSSSLSYNTHAAAAARLGRTEQAYAYFHRAAGMDLDNLHDATRDGLHAASQGGSWQAVVMGFGGLTQTEDGFDFDPHLPPAWKALRFRLLHRGTCCRVTLTADGGATVQREAGG
ncbi:MAG: glycoside hydrolase family 65 protein [Lentisphaerae bacterium]|nr:glycoside hydrolase family 65 protein [Lentisphaerota bacterium]